MHLDLRHGWFESGMTAMRRLLGCIGIVGLLVVASAFPSHADFSLPTLSVTDCSATDVTISTTDALSTLGFDIDVSFDAAVVAVDDVIITGTDTEGCEFAFNDANP